MRTVAPIVAVLTLLSLAATPTTKNSPPVDLAVLLRNPPPEASGPKGEAWTALRQTRFIKWATDQLANRVVSVKDVEVSNASELPDGTSVTVIAEGPTLAVGSGSCFVAIDCRFRHDEKAAENLKRGESIALKGTATMAEIFPLSTNDRQQEFDLRLTIEDGTILARRRPK